MRFARAEPEALVRKESPHSNLYDIAWERLPALVAPDNSSAEGSWLLFADRGGTADRLAAAIEAAGGRCHRVLAGNRFERTEERTWTVDPALPQHFHQLLQRGEWNVSKSLRGVIHCWSLDAATGFK